MEGTPFGRYRLLELIGRGGMGEVWRAYDTATDRMVAVKVLPAHLLDDQTFEQRFRREANAAAALNEPHVVPIHNFGEIEGRLYVDMRLIDGRDLQSLLSEGGVESCTGGEGGRAGGGGVVRRAQGGIGAPRRQAVEHLGR